jgi:murein DD-endopeptidase MepM/ murein hydrolase activator NlpD
VGAIITRSSNSRRLELWLAVFGAVAVLSFWGSSAEGQGSLLDAWLSDYVEEKATAWVPPPAASTQQLADLNSIYAGVGGDSSALSPAPSLEAATINQSALVANTPPDSSYLERIVQSRFQIVEYTVHQGDLLSFIASDFGVSTDSIVWANNLRNADAISPGTVLRIPPVTGVIHKVAKGDTTQALAAKYRGDAARIIAYNRLPQDGALDVGDEVIIPDGVMPNRAPAVATASIARAVQSVKQFAHLPNLGGYFNLPTFGYNWGRIHGRNGIDVANSCGTSINAAAEGIVTVADPDGYNGGFGKYVKISHPNGTETLYAHASKLFVGAGQAVGKGERIALMGTTGRSTGCHLHFEVHGAQNPLVKK